MTKRELKQQKRAKMAKLPGGPLGLEALWAWRPYGLGGPPVLAALWAWGPFELGGPPGLKALWA